MSIFTLAYQSRNLIEDLTIDSSSELEKLLQVSRARNVKLSITGALLFNEGSFVQILEGDEASVREVFRRIEKDSRHTDIVVRPTGFSERRRFGKWSMAFVGITPGARDYYKLFSMANGFEWTKATAEAIGDLMLDLIMFEGQSPPEEGPPR